MQILENLGKYGAQRCLT